MNQRIVIVGAGNVATHLARTMKKKVLSLHKYGAAR